jgi:hypothetical protein
MGREGEKRKSVREDKMPLYTLTEAALRLGRSYNQTLRLVLVGELEGRQEAGRWLITAESLERLQERRLGAQTPRGPSA